MLKEYHTEKDYIVKFRELYLTSSNLRTITFTDSPFGAYVFKKEQYKEDDDMMNHLTVLLNELAELGFKDVKIIERTTNIEKYEKEIEVK